MGTVNGDEQAKNVFNSILGWTIIPFRRISDLLSFLPPSFLPHREGCEGRL